MTKVFFLPNANNQIDFSVVQRVRNAAKASPLIVVMPILSKNNNMPPEPPAAA